MLLLNLFLMFFAGFAVGRLGHIYWGDKIDAFDHN